MVEIEYRGEVMRTGRQRPQMNGQAWAWAEALHPCQKPLTFADRMIRASSRPGEAVWVPFGGTCREAVAAERMARREPAEARRVVTAELDEDGRDYLGAVVAQLGGEDTRARDGKQADMFGGTP